MLFVIILAGIITFYIILKSLTLNWTANDSFVMINARKVDNIEYTVRNAVHNHPKSDIYVLNRCTDKEMSDILQLLKHDYPNIYIIDC